MSFSAAASSTSSAPPATINYALGNTYSRLPDPIAPLDRTGRHSKIHDWTLYIDILPGSDPDMVERVTFDMRDDSFQGLGFTCHCPIRIRDVSLSQSSQLLVASRGGGEDIGAFTAPNSESTAGTASSENATTPQTSSITTDHRGQSTAEPIKLPSTNPRPRNASRYRFSTRQQTYGPVDVRITIRGVGGSKSIIDYRVVLREGATEVFGSFVERRPNSKLRPIKMVDGKFHVKLCFGLSESDESNDKAAGGEFSKEHYLQNGADNRALLQHIAKSIYARSKRPMRAVLYNACNGESWTEEWCGTKKSQTDGSRDDNAWTLSFDHSNTTKKTNDGAQITPFSHSASPTSISISSPNLIGGNGLNECYKVVEGLPPLLSCTYPFANITPIVQQHHHSFHVHIDVSPLSLAQIIKVCQNFIKYEEAIDSFMPFTRRDDRCSDCRSNKLAMKRRGANADQELTNKERNVVIGRCASVEELTSTLNPLRGASNTRYKLNLNLGHSYGTDMCNRDNATADTKLIEFLQHPTSKDKTTITHWIRFCMAFVKNSARLRAPMALKNTTSLEEEFDLLFEYVVKDRALENFYKERRDHFSLKEEEERVARLVMENIENDAMSISGGSDEEVSGLITQRKREFPTNDMNKNKRHCS